MSISCSRDNALDILDKLINDFRDYLIGHAGSYLLCEFRILRSLLRDKEEGSSTAVSVEAVICESKIGYFNNTSMMDLIEKLGLRPSGVIVHPIDEAVAKRLGWDGVRPLWAWAETNLYDTGLLELHATRVPDPAPAPPAKIEWSTVIVDKDDGLVVVNGRTYKQAGPRRDKIVGGVVVGWEATYNIPASDFVWKERIPMPEYPFKHRAKFDVQPPNFVDKQKVMKLYVLFDGKLNYATSRVPWTESVVIDCEDPTKVQCVTVLVDVWGGHVDAGRVVVVTQT